MDPFYYSCRILFIFSFVLNLYLINLSFKNISVHQCFSANKEYKDLLLKEAKKSEACLERELIEQMKTTKTIRTTTNFPKYEEQLKKPYVTPCLTLKDANSTFKDDGFVRNCISGDILGKVGVHAHKILDINLNSKSNSKKETDQMRVKAFEKVFDSQAWGRNWDPGFKGMSASGEGSTIHWTQEISAVLHAIINTVKRTKPLNTKVRVLDVPCGDMVWMSRFLMTRDDVEYTGMDIVLDLIQHHRAEFKDQPWSFFLKDIVEVEEFAQYDIIIARMFFQHLFDFDTLKVLKLFSNSNSSYLLTTTFPRLDKNNELKSTDENPGRYRAVNLELPPFSLTQPICYTRDGPPHKNYYAALWELPLSFHKGCKKNITENASKPWKNGIQYFTCSRTNFLKEF